MIRRVGLFALIAVVVVVLGWYGLFWRSNAHLSAASRPRNSSRPPVSSERATLFGLEAQTKLGQDQSVLQQLVKAVPNGPSLDELMDTLNSARESGVVIGTVARRHPKGGPPTGSLAARPIHRIGTGIDRRQPERGRD